MYYLEDPHPSQVLHGGQRGKQGLHYNPGMVLHPADLESDEGIVMDHFTYRSSVGQSCTLFIFLCNQ